MCGRQSFAALRPQSSGQLANITAGVKTKPASYAAAQWGVQNRSHGRLRRRAHDPRAEAEAVHTVSMYLRFSSVPDVRAGDDVLRVDHLRGPFLFRILSRVSKIGPLLVGRPSVVLREVEHDAFCGRSGAGRGPYFSFKYG